MADLLDRLKAALSERYAINRELGHGGMAVVYLARDEKLNRQVALKVLRPELAASLGSERFLREIEIAAKLTHPNILALHDCGEADGQLYYTMPYVEGESLRDRLRREKQLPIDDALQITKEVADALGYAHSLGLVHRDIKPENILFTAGHAVVSDFGIARAVTEAGGEHLTETGLTVGTPVYMSREQASGTKEIDARSDLYSLGCVLYEMLAGEPPFAAPTVQALVAKVLTVPPPRVTAVRDRVPSSVEAAIDQALAKVPADRFRTAVHFSDALHGTDAPPVTQARRRLPGRRAAILVMAAIAVVVLGAYGAWWFFTTGRPGTVFATGVMDPGDRVLLADFVNRTGDSILGYAVHEGLRALLSDPRLVRLVDPWSVQGALERMGLLPDTRLEGPVAREIAERENAKVLIMGEVSPLGAGYQLTARVVGVVDSVELRIERETAQSEGDIVDAVDRLGAKLRRGIGESVQRALAQPPLPDVATGSIEALRAFATAMHMENRGEDHPRVIRLLEEAVAIDTTFAEAYRWLAGVNGNLGNAATAVAAIDQAYRWRERLPLIQRLWIEGDYHANHGDLPAATAVYQRVLDLDPQNGVALAHLSDKQLVQRDFAAAESLAMRFLESGYTWYVGYWNAVEALVAQRRFAAADSVLAGMAPVAGQAELRLELLLAKRDWSAASSYHSSDSLIRAYGLCPWCPPLLALVQGRLAEADRLWNASSRWGTTLTLSWLLCQARYREGDTARISRDLDALLERVDWDSRPPERRGSQVLIPLLAALGRVPEARERIDEWRALGSGDPRLAEFADYCEGAILLAEEEFDDAAAAFIRSHGAPFSSATHVYNRGLVEAAGALDRLGHADSAIALYEGALNQPVLAGIYEVAWYPFVLRRLGELHESLSHRDQAIDYYSQFIDLWKDADPELQPQVEAARQALARLMAEPPN